jgi:hypothetical protein
LCSSKNIFVYDEAKKVSDTKVDVAMIAEAKEVIKVMYEISPRFSFRRSDVTSAMKVIAEVMKEKASLKDDHVEAWIEVHTRRLMNLCHVVSQGLAPSRVTPQWVRDLPIPDEAKPKGKPPATKAAKTTDIEYTYGFSKELKLAWRADSADPKLRKVMAQPFEVQGMPDDKFPVAIWTDGHEKEISNITVGGFKKLVIGRKGSAEPNLIWSGEHSVNHNKLAVKKRPDRSLLIVMYEQQKMVLGVRTALFDASGEDPEGEAAVTAATKVIMQVATMYMQNEITAEQLYPARNDLLAKLNIKARGGSVRAGGAMKRPAAASANKKPACKKIAQDEADEDEEEDEDTEADKSSGEGEDEVDENGEEDESKSKPKKEQVKVKPTKAAALKRPAAASSEDPSLKRPSAAVEGMADADELSTYLPIEPITEDGFGDMHDL